jgi:hypothetical protein
VNFGLTPAGTLSPGDPRVQMQPRDVPVIHINTETEVAIGVLVPNGLAYRRDDSDAPEISYRYGKSRARATSPTTTRTRCSR